MTIDNWAFDVPRNAVAVTTARVAEDRAPILLVQHLPDDEGWTFLDGGPFDVSQALLVTMSHALDLDPSLRQLSDLPEGWLARRTHPAAPWRREVDDPCSD